MIVAAHLREYALLMRLNRPIGILLLMWPTLWGLWVASHGRPDMLVLSIFVLGVVLMRSAGCVINDYADRDIDPLVERTRDRPLAAKRISTKEALALFVVLCLVAFVLVLQLNRLTILLSLAGAFLAASYPFMKRYTHLPQVYLGAAFGWSIPMAFAAQTGEVPTAAWVMFFANLFWAVAYDTAYAMVDRQDDMKVGVKSTAILFGKWDRHMIALAHLICLLLLIKAGSMVELGTFFYLGLTAAAGLAVYQQKLIHQRDPKLCFRAFLNNSWFGAVIFAGLVLNYMVQV